MGFLVPLLGLGLSALGTGYSIHSQNKQRKANEKWQDEQDAIAKENQAKQEREARRSALTRALGGSLETRPVLPFKDFSKPEDYTLGTGVSQSIANLGTNLFANPEKVEALYRKLTS